MSDDKRWELIKEFFKICPDYSLCRTLADNIAEGNVTYDRAIRLLHERAADLRILRGPIKEQIDRKKISAQGKWRLLKDMSFEDIRQLDDRALQEVLGFYFKHPYAHERVAPPSALKPRAWRIRFLRRLLEHARKRELDLDYYEWDQLLLLI